MNEIEKEMLKNFGGADTTIAFFGSKKVLIIIDGSDELIKNVNSIDIPKIGEIASLKINYTTKEGERSISSAIENINKLIVMD